MNKNVIFNFNWEKIKIFEVGEKWTKEWFFFNALFPIKPDKTKNIEFEKNVRDLFNAIMFHYVFNKIWNKILKIENWKLILFFNNWGNISIWNQYKEIRLDLKKRWNIETGILQYISSVIYKNKDFPAIFFTIMYNSYFNNKKYNTLDKYVSSKETVDVLNKIYENIYIEKQSV